MGLIRMITIAAILYLIYKVARHFTNKGKFPVKADKHKSDTNKQDQNEIMVACQYCDLRVPKKQAIEQGGQWFCSQAHLKAHNDS